MRVWSRRELLITSGGAMLLAACGSGGSSSAGGSLVGPTDPAVERCDASMRKPGAAKVAITITALAVTVDIGGREVSTWAFGDRPGMGGIRAKVGDLVRSETRPVRS